MSISSQHRLVAVPDLVAPMWDERVAREVEHQARIEEAFDGADACGRLGFLEAALEWLARADGLSGGLSPAYRAQHRRWTYELAERGTPVTSSQGIA